MIVHELKFYIDPLLLPTSKSYQQMQKFKFHYMYRWERTVPPKKLSCLAHIGDTSLLDALVSFMDVGMRGRCRFCWFFACGQTFGQSFLLLVLLGFAKWSWFEMLLLVILRRRGWLHFWTSLWCRWQRIGQGNVVTLAWCGGGMRLLILSIMIDRIVGRRLRRAWLRCRIWCYCGRY